MPPPNLIELRIESERKRSTLVKSAKPIMTLTPSEYHKIKKESKKARNDDRVNKFRSIKRKKLAFRIANKKKILEKREERRAKNE